MRLARIALLGALVSVFAACGVQGPPRPPRLQLPQQITDLHVEQTGRTLQIDFTFPVLATDGERLTKPVTVHIYRTVSPPGKKPAAPDTSGTPWLTLLPKQHSAYTTAGRLDYPYQFSPQEFRRQLGKSFAFAVVAFTRGFRGRSHKSAPSNVGGATLINVTEPATNLVVTPSQSALLLTWTKPAATLTGAPPAHLSGYRIYQSRTGKHGSFKLAGESPGTRFADRNFQFGQQYYFRVSALTKVGNTVAESDPSPMVSITPRDVFPPPVPERLTAVNAAGAVDLLWNASVASDLAGYNVYRKSAGGAWTRINKQIVPTPIFHDTSVKPGQTYEYAATAVDLNGNESSKSQPARITVRAQPGR